MAELQSIIEQPELQLLRLQQATSDQAEAQQIKALAAEHQVCVVVENDWQLAQSIQAYGVHLPIDAVTDEVVQQLNAQGLRLGVTVSSYQDIARADALEVSYMEIALSQVDEQALDQLEEWVELLSDFYPVIASGVSADMAEQAMATGLDGLLVSVS